MERKKDLVYGKEERCNLWKGRKMYGKEWRESENAKTFV